MAKKLFLLRNVPDDEAEDIRQLLQAHDIPFFESSSGFLDLGTAAIWLSNDTQFEQAKTLLDDYQSERFQRARSEYLTLRADKQHTKLIDALRRDPLRFILYCLLALLLLSLTTLPFWL